jgi:tetratricopeptide (TPR) repeat protein
LVFAGILMLTANIDYIPEFLTRIPPIGWAALVVLIILLLGLVLYFFTIDELELGISPKIKFKRRGLSRKQEAATQLEPRGSSPQPLEQTITAPTESAIIKLNLAHPYALQANFTGRKQERDELTAWLAYDVRPICELVAMGGMGKSALAWYWIQKDVLPSAQPDASAIEGVMWWSFYEGESSFAKFVDDALKYVSGEPKIDVENLPTTYDRAQELRKQLQTKRMLFVLDGFERQLRAYASLDAAYQQDNTANTSREARACIDPIAARLLTDIVAGSTSVKVLLTTRLPVSDLEDRAGDSLAGVLKRELKELPRDDAVAFMRAQGVTRGTHAEIAAVCAAYGYHPLSLRLLSGLISRDARTPGDIAAAPRHDVHDDIVQRQHHVLQQSYNALPKRERTLLSRIAAFRNPVTYDALMIFNTFGDEAKFDAVLEDLRVRGLLQRDTVHNRYDLHPIVRHYSYDRLTDKTGVHTRLRDYFAKIPAPDENKVQSIEDLTPIVELYHHTVRAGRYDEAVHLLRARLVPYPLHYRLGAYQLMIELKLALFPDGVDRPPRLKEIKAQSWVLSALASSYSFVGQPRQAMRFYLLAIAMDENLGDKSSLALDLSAVASVSYHPLGELATAERTYRHSIELSNELKDEFQQAISHAELGRLFVYCGLFDEAEKEFAIGIKLHGDTLEGQWSQATSWFYRVEGALLRHDIPQAIKSARKAKRLKDIEFPGVGKIERDAIQAELLLGAALVMEGKTLNTAATHLTEALTRCRRINLVEFEPNILLAWARWYHVRGNAQEAHAHAEEARVIADRCEFRLAQAEIHNFLARLALEANDHTTAREHAEIARERAWCDGPPYCYKPALDEALGMLRELGMEG